MKKFLLIALAFLTFAGIARAVEDLSVLRPLKSYGDWATTTAKVAGDNAGVFIIATHTEVLRILSAHDAFISFAASSPSAAVFIGGVTSSVVVTPIATKATGFLIPASTPVMLRVSGNSLISIIASTTAGGIHFTEMGK